MIQKALPQDAFAIAKLAVQMWEDHEADALAAEFEDMLKASECVVFLCWEGGAPVGFAQCQLRRDYVEGTESSPVGYLEGIFVEERCRHKGYAGELLRACEDWAKERGCTEFASDCEMGNTASFAFHMRMGFEEANRIICFTKKL